jgi:hypothetical protein
MGSFNYEMDAYLSKRKKENTANSDRNKNSAQKFLNFMYGETKVEEANEEKFKEEYEKKEPKKGVFSKLKEWLSFEEAADEEDFEKPKEEAVSTVNEDIKEVLKLQNKWLSKLSSKTIREFKESEDYKRIKVLLEKNNLIKKN